jgi:acyl-CoA oxidase
MTTYKTFPGLEIGELGGKYGFLQVDNGYMMFTNYRIPRENMLARLSEVTPDGRFVKKTDSKVGYGAMMFIRAGITGDAAIKLSRAATIAVRYGMVRR